jgi:ankyrin repeat protein
MAIVELLLAKGADPNEGIEYAADNGHMDIVELLLAKGDLSEHWHH